VLLYRVTPAATSPNLFLDLLRPTSAREIARTEVRHAPATVDTIIKHGPSIIFATTEVTWFKV
jgi:hypothetical protein